MNWLFRQVWVWILIAFVLGLILTWIYVVHKASRTVETTDDSRPEDKPEADHDDSRHGAAVVGGVAAAGAGVAGVTAAATHHEDADQRDGGGQDDRGELDEAHDADGVHDAGAKAGASAGSSKTADDSDGAPTEAGDGGPFDQDAPVGGEPTAANDSVGPTSDKTTASSSRDDQPEAAGAAAAAKARAQAEEQRDTAPTEEQHDTAPTEAPDAAADGAAGQSADGDLTEQATDGDTAVKAGAAGVGVAAATGIGVAAVHHQRAAESDTGEPPAEGRRPAEETPDVGQVGGAPAVDTASPNTDQDHTDQDPMQQRFGSGAASPRPDGSAPDGYTVKGNADSMLFHTNDSPRYAATRPQVWFKDEASASSAGFAHWDRTKRGAFGTTPAHAARQHPTGDATGSSGGVGTDTADTTAAPAAALPADNAPVDEAPTDEAPRAEAAPTDEAPADETPADDVRGETAGPQDATTGADESEPDPIREQFGSGAASPREDGSAPSLSYTIKGNADTMMFHTEDSPGFDDTEAEIWFRDEASAKAAGFIHWDRTKR